jgi:molecular chaperone DnaK
MNKKPIPAIGIDLGTTFSVVAYLDPRGKPETIRNSEGDLTTPSVVFFDHDQPIVGKEAVKISTMEPENVVRCAKREVGKDFFHQSIRDEQLPPEVIQALVLKKLKDDAEIKLGEISKAVVTVPAFFNEPRRKSTQDAGQLAGLEVIDIINEPTAAAIAYGVQQGFLSESGATQRQERILIYDLGGGTFDVTLLDIKGHQYNAIATAGDVFLGGIDWDQRIIDHLAEQFQQEHGVDLREDPVALQTLIQDAEDAKRSLSQRDSINIGVNHGGQRLRIKLARSEFESMTEDLLQRTLFTTQKLLERANCAWDELTRVLLVGGASRMPMVQEMLEKQSATPVDRSLDPDECVAHGAAIYAQIVLDSIDGQRPQIEVTNVNSHDLGVLGQERATGMTRQRVLLARNTPLPATGSEQFTTRKNNQQQVVVDVVEGGDASGTNSTPIGRCLVTDLPPGLPAGTPINVRFTYTHNGRLEVAASVTGTEQETSLVIERAAGLSPKEITYWTNRLQIGFTQEDVKASVLNKKEAAKRAADPIVVVTEETEDIVVVEQEAEPIVVITEETEDIVVVEQEPEVATLVEDPEDFVLIEDPEASPPRIKATETAAEPVAAVESAPLVTGPEVIYESDEEFIVEAIPALIESSSPEETGPEEENFFASLVDNEDNETEEPKDEDSVKSVDDDLNDFFKNFD